MVVNIVVFVLILIVGKIVISILCNFLGKTLEKSLPAASDILRGFIMNVAHKILWVLLLMIALQRLGIDIAPLIAGLGVTGFIIGFAFQDSLSNLAAGMMIALNQPFRIGDFVETSGASGVIKDMNMMATTLTTGDNKKIVVPNSAVWGNTIVNYTALDTRRVDLTVGISYNDDINQAKDVIKRSAWRNS